MVTSIPILPNDAGNRTLVNNVRPTDWLNPEPTGRYNLVVVGGGTAGLVCAAGAAGLGARVALIERHLLGGDCLNVGCVPSKGMIRASRALFDARSADAFGVVGAEGATGDFGRVMERMRAIRAGIGAHDAARRFRDELGVDVVDECPVAGIIGQNGEGCVHRLLLHCVKPHSSRIAPIIKPPWGDGDSGCKLP